MQVTDNMIDAACETYDLRSGMTSSCERAYMKSAIQAAMQAAWVDIEKRKPKKQRGVLVAGKGTGTVIAFRGDDDWFYFLDTPIHSLTHWMPLPEFKE